MSLTIHAQQKTFEKEVAYLKENGKDPVRYVIGKFSTYDIVMLGENHAIKENLDFVTGLIPSLYKAGVYNLGMEFGASEMQSRLDSLINAPQYDEQVARDMMYFYNVGWAYKEYPEIYRAVWRFNKSLPAGARKFRIVNLSYQYDWSSFDPQRTPENMAKVFHKGPVDKFRAEIVEKEIIDKKEKALLYVGSVHAFTKFKMGILKMNNVNFTDYDDGFLGNWLYKKYPEKVFNINLHCSLFGRPDKRVAEVSPANGALEQIMKEMKYEPVGFDMIHSPLALLSDNSTYSQGYKDFTIGQLFDGYIFLKPYDQLTGCTIDTLFFKNRSWEETKKQMPDPNWFVAQNLDEYWTKIKGYATMRFRYKDIIDSSVPKVNGGRLIRFKNFKSGYVQPRNVDVWLPENYDASKKYAVLYMHDGQMLFDSTTTWNKQEWQVDEIFTRLLGKKAIKDCIVVGIWNNGEYRHAEYFPQKAIDYLSPMLKDTVIGQYLKGKPQADNYLNFLTKELKPFVDSVFATMPDQENTFIAGSSMGGLISMYAVCEYPEVFGGAACLSTHWTGIFNRNQEIPDAFFQYLKSSLPSPQKHKFYFDYGSEGLDSMYKPSQKKVDAVLLSSGYSSRSLMTREFKGADHSERSWSKRLDIPVVFLLGRK